MIRSILKYLHTLQHWPDEIPAFRGAEPETGCFAPAPFSFPLELAAVCAGTLELVDFFGRVRRAVRFAIHDDLN